MKSDVGGLEELLKNYIRWLLMPGFDLFTRRRVRLCRYWLRGPRCVLDAGSGNGWFSYLAYRSGATVTAINFNETEVQKAIKFYNVWLAVPSEQLQFIKLNLYEIGSLKHGFDEIICYEALEHIKDDIRIGKEFYRLLKPGGILHLCCPNANHPKWRNELLDLEERGYHVRSGYNLDSYRLLLQPIGFEIKDVEGMGGLILSWLCCITSKMRNRFGDVLSAPLILSAIPFVWLDPIHPRCPYSIYVRAVKR